MRCNPCLVEHFLQLRFEKSLVMYSWLTIILCVSILFLVNSWISLSVSYNDKNSAMHTQINVDLSYHKIVIN